MKHISILVPFGHASLPNIDGTHQLLNDVNGCAARMGLPKVFDIQLVGISPEIIQRNGRFTIQTDCLIDQVKKTDLIIIPAIHGDLQQAIDTNAEFLPWIAKQYQNGAEVASLCIGAFLLAATGLLSGKQCATHWAEAHKFAQMFPDVHVVDDKIMTHEDRIYTSGGAYSFLNLLIYLIEKNAGREVAIMMSKLYMIDIDRYSQSPFIMFQGQKDHDDEAVQKAQQYIEDKFDDKITVEELADKFAVGRRTLERRFKKATGNTVIEYMQRVKIEAAKRSFETSRKNISEVMFDVGYTDTKAFRDVFRKITGLTPVEYRNKYNRGVVVA
ncbi:GlxA family transcriptional regulator [Flavobacterium caeni]|uniref:Transcriptional regulator GlxA family, contains an amidase domain and an AraC-type DNA-binding HTH domain n=1 Tax=Flavobacterium caeni TaxID=490189 RepID=A0A1G5FR46_9FLAO|nr:helix-turn-helix domain-containing protein [Flavobacterium caeni]SCY41706.1 Transcriptional regulator GlxA family, contains an amidase domain and an AraC-type DNA-binding HTH domain [Flavobacterium caeni]